MKKKILVDFLLPFLAKQIDSQRSIVIIVISQTVYSSMFLKEFMEDEAETFDDIRQFESWIYQLIRILTENAESKNETIRKYCYRGIGNLSYLTNLKNNPKLIDLNLAHDDLFVLTNDQASAVFKILLRGMEDFSPICVKEALSSFQRIVEGLNPIELADSLSEICGELRVSFER